ncbi:MAG: hypothetical protein CL583_06680 [Alteromonadaceae bacterium]|nr:hypothetical protein [Alteromonadaceae bacterium]
MRFAQACRLSTAIAAVMAASVAQAELNLNGFMSVGAGMTTGSDETLYGYDDKISFQPDSLVGIQAMADLDNNFSATAQLTARGSDNNEVNAEWAYLSYQATPELRINAGRQRMPLYMYSDYLDVGYAYHWVSPPGTFYNSPISSFNGLSINYSTYVGDFETGLQVVGGSASEEGLRGSSFEYDINFENYVGAVATIGYGPVVFRATYQQTKMDLTGGSAFEGFAALAGMVAASNPELADELVTEGVDLTFAGLGVSVDWNSLLFVAEVREQKYKDSVVPDELAYYGSVAYQVGDFMPYASVERAESSGEREMAATLAALSPALAGARNAMDEDRHTYTAGVRYNFHPSAALKAEYTVADDHRDTAGLPGGTGGDASLVRFAVDAVF